MLQSIGEGVVEKFVENGIVTDLNLPDAPDTVCTITYPNGKKVELGNILTPTEAQEIPSMIYPTETSHYYTIIMTDPDVPSRADPVIREVQHWVVGNIPGKKIENGTVITAYQGPRPPKFTSLHRYVFLVYKQSGLVEFTEDTITTHQTEERIKFSVGKFAKKYQLGAPVAGNFFEAEWDSSVPV